MSSNQRIEVLGVPVDQVSAPELLWRVRAWVTGDSCQLIFTPNPEMCVGAQRNATFRDALHRGDLNIPDSIGLVFAARFLNRAKLTRLPGADAMELLCREAATQGWRVFLLGGGADVARRAAAALSSKYSSLKIRHSNLALPTTLDGQSNETQSALRELAQFQPHLLFVALGAPKQELWLTQNRGKLTKTGVKAAMAVGGTFDYLAGSARRAPRFLRSLGLEWLVRLVTQPRRLKRILRATLVFPWLVVTTKARPTPAP